MYALTMWLSGDCGTMIATAGVLAFVLVPRLSAVRRAPKPAKRRWECSHCLGGGKLPDSGLTCYLCAGTGLKNAVKLGFKFDYGRIANMEYEVYGRTWPCLGATCSCPAHCLVHAREAGKQANTDGSFPIASKTEIEEARRRLLQRAVQAKPLVLPAGIVLELGPSTDPWQKLIDLQNEQMIRAFLAMTADTHDSPLCTRDRCCCR